MDQHKNVIRFAEAQASLRLLKDGNARHVTGTPKPKWLDKNERAALTKGQNPYAVVLGCADSRVAPELVFDVGLGELFGIRNMGNIVSDAAIASIEYAIEQLHCPLVVVLAHSNCGAVDAAISGKRYTRNIDKVLATIAPSVQKGTDADEIAKAHAIRMAAAIRDNHAIIVNGGVVMPAYYDIATGEVIWL